MSDNQIPLCPLMSAGNDIPQVCTQERCAWYMKNVRACSLYVIAHSQLTKTKASQ